MFMLFLLLLNHFTQHKLRRLKKKQLNNFYISFIMRCLWLTLWITVINRIINMIIIGIIIIKNLYSC